MEIMKKVSKKKQTAVIFFVAVVALVILLTGCNTSSNAVSSINNNTDSSVPAGNSEEGTVAADAEVAQLSGTCPRGKSCSYPGECGSYIDLDNNGLCDCGE